MHCSRRWGACTVTSCTRWIYAALSCFCAVTRPNWKCSKLPYHRFITMPIVYLRYNSKLCNVYWLWVSISIAPTSTVFRTFSIILLSSRYKNPDFILGYPALPYQLLMYICRFSVSKLHCFYAGYGYQAHPASWRCRSTKTYGDWIRRS